MRTFCAFIFIFLCFELVGRDDKQQEHILSSLDKVCINKERNRVFNVNGVSFTMVYVAGGSFIMGATQEQAKYAGKQEKPKHEVSLFSYYLCATEVTQELWIAVMGYNPSYYQDSKRPVERVSWDDCQLFINKLNNLTGESFRLPTESEWEYAARGGENSNGFIYSGSNLIEDVAWYYNNSANNTSPNDINGFVIDGKKERTHTVATKIPNELGIYDMSGNVWEWCQDYYGKYRKHKKKDKMRIFSKIDLSNNLNDHWSPLRVIRGGAWNDYAGSCRVSNRGALQPDCPHFSVGFRLAL